MVDTAHRALHPVLQAYKFVRTSPHHIAVIPCPRSMPHERETSLARSSPMRAPSQNGSNPMILITGASGSVGKAVLQEAIRTQTKVRAMYRSKEEAAKAPPRTEPVLADYADKSSLRSAL